LLLAEGGCRVFVLAHPKSYVAKSRHLSGVISGSFNAEENIENLRRHLGSGARYDWVIFVDDPTDV